MHELVKDYYGKQLAGTADLKTSACCDASGVPGWLKPLLARIHPEVLERYYGCGLVAPPLLAGCRVLDLGSGSGRDVYALAQLVGAQGEVVGVDMTDEQLDVAVKHRAWHAERFGYANVRFLHGYIERLDELDLAPASFDVIVSNCVVNLSPDKEAVLRGVQRLRLHPVGQSGDDLAQSSVRRPGQCRVSGQPDLGQAKGQRLHLQPGQHLRRQGGVFGQGIAIARRPVDQPAARPQGLDIAIDLARGNTGLLGQPGGGDRGGQAAQGGQKAEQAVGAGHGMLTGSGRSLRL